MDSLNRKYGWDIRVMTSTKGVKVSEKVKEKKKAEGPQTYLMLAIEMKDGKHFLSRVNPSFARSIEGKLHLVREIRSHQWYTAQESYFGGLSTSKKPSGQKNLKSRLRETIKCTHSISYILSIYLSYGKIPYSALKHLVK